jgi:hypothetical protein
MLVIFIAIDPVELQALREFGSEADFAPPQRGSYLNFLVRDTRARAACILCFPCQTTTRSFFAFPRSSPPFLSRMLPASRLILRARLCTCRRASAVTRTRTRTRTRTNTNPNGTDAYASGSSVRACVARES